jgi:hypothetical protein
MTFCNTSDTQLCLQSIASYPILILPLLENRSREVLVQLTSCLPVSGSRIASHEPTLRSKILPQG